MKRNKIVKLLTGLGLIGVMIGSMFIGGAIGRHKTVRVNTPKILVEQHAKEATVNYKEIIVDGLKEMNQFRVIQSSLREQVKVQNCQYDNKIFKNNNIVTVKGNGNYYLNLGNLEENVIVKGNDVYIIGKIDIEVALNEEDVTIENEKGFLSLYKKELSGQELNNILVNSKEIMFNKASQDDYIKTAKEKAEDSIIKLLDTLDHENNLKVHMIWK
ncbi:MAG: DUF4230 domain-containing protein [Terrisporobacter sp.]|uniref:DUF4230 domain-containing protein n=1 Tax=Terrisporobacter sp. TaxID=1965305 RepID=UPI002A91595C|nr:DUF4230 domain-containing protein [Terrisporobacter sp.]MDY6153724.1 DUF4230 domain-containing protein [Terrisporobacter sp.]